MREFILRKTSFESYIDFNGEKVFESATVDTSITTFSKTPPTPSHQVFFFSCSDYSTLSSPCFDSLPQSSLSTQTLTFSSSSIMALKEKIESVGTPLKEWDISINYGVKTGYNEAFIITTEKREEILAHCKTQEEREATEQIIKKMLRGRDIKRYSYEWADLWLINTHNGYTTKEGERIPPIDINHYPTLKKHLDSHIDKLTKRTDKGDTPYNLRNCAYVEEFDKEKIIYPNMTKFRPFILERCGIFTNQKCFIITSKTKNSDLYFLVGILNSWVFDFAFAEKFPNLLGETLELGKVFMEKLPIPKITKSNQPIADKIIALVEEILLQKETNNLINTQKLEKEIDNLVYTLYNLTEEEIKIIEGEK